MIVDAVRASSYLDAIIFVIDDKCASHLPSSILLPLSPKLGNDDGGSAKISEQLHVVPTTLL